MHIGSLVIKKKSWSIRPLQGYILKFKNDPYEIFYALCLALKDISVD